MAPLASHSPLWNSWRRSQPSCRCRADRGQRPRADPAAPAAGGGSAPHGAGAPSNLCVGRLQPGTCIVLFGPSSVWIRPPAGWQPVTSWALWAFSALFQKSNLEKDCPVRLSRSVGATPQRHSAQRCHQPPSGYRSGAEKARLKILSAKPERQRRDSQMLHIVAIGRQILCNNSPVTALRLYRGA
jgi:hypothetical protein